MPLPRTSLAGWSFVAVFALIGAALIATVLWTRSTVRDASQAVGRGQALAVEQAVRGDLADLGGPPSPDDLASMLRDHNEDGLRYIAMLDHGHIEASAGTPVGTLAERTRIAVREVEDIGHGRVRVETRMMFRRAWGANGRAWGFVLEIEPVQAEALHAAATRTLMIGAIAAITLLGVAFVLVRREVRRQADERARERERRLASLGEMSAVLAHEIKNPLASLKGNAQLLAAMLPAGEKPRAKADRVVDETIRLEKLTNDLLAFVRTGQISRANTEVVALVHDAAARHGTAIAIEAPAGLGWSLDADRMRQVLVNLFDNAIQAGAPVRATVRGGDRLVIEIADRGPGVPDDIRDKIFEPFFTSKTQGTGLGLALSHRIVEQHGGTLDVTNAPGGGAVFRIEIPRGGS